MSRIIIISLVMALIAGCARKSGRDSIVRTPVAFDAGTLNPEMKAVKQVRGQLLYLPVYSNVPYQIDTIKFDMSAFVAIHNTDLEHKIILTKVLYFDQNGNTVDDFLGNTKFQLNPLATKEFYIPYEDKSGTGANFLIEWVADTLVNEPLVESITICVKPNNSVAVLSQGKVMREIRE